VWINTIDKYPWQSHNREIVEERMQKNIFYKHLLMLLVFAILILLAVASASTPSTASSGSSSNKSTDVMAYVLENGEKLRTLIVTQNDLNEYAKHENEPTARFYKEMFTEFEKVFDENFKKIIEDDIKEFQQEFPDISLNEFIDIFRKIGFFYKIEYNRNLRVWHIELIGKSTTLRLDFSNTRREGMSYYHRVVPYVNRWMELNNVEDLDVVFRVYINDIDDATIPELFGIPFSD
jgi:hypothetical protein